MDVGPVFVSDDAHARAWRGHNVGARQHVEPASRRDIADIDAEGLGWIADVDVPIVAAAVNVNIADNRLGRAGDAVAADIEEAENRPGAVPFLAEGRLG